MISVELWRAQIGHFNGKFSGSLSSLSFDHVCFTFYQGFCRRNERLTTKQEESPHTTICRCSPVFDSICSLPIPDKPSLLTSRLSISSGCFWSSQVAEALVRLILAVLAIISRSLIISGDVETNPGPLSCEYFCLYDDRPS